MDKLLERMLDEMQRRMDQDHYINRSADGYTADHNPEHLVIDDTQIGIEFAFEFLRPFLNATEAEKTEAYDRGQKDAVAQIVRFSKDAFVCGDVVAQRIKDHMS